MRIIECKQGTPEWLAARAGLCTASCFADAISTVGGLDERQQKFVDFVLSGVPEKAAAERAGYKAVPTSQTVAAALRGEETATPSDTARRYAADLAMERISGAPYGEPPKSWVLARGHEMEALARMHYEARTKSLVTEAGLCVMDDAPFAYSTDGLVDDDGLIEIKAPIDSLKIDNIRETGDISEYLCQIYGGLWLTGRKWCDFIMYVPALANRGNDLYVKRIYRDEKIIEEMVEKLAKFDAMVQRYEANFSKKI